VRSVSRICTHLSIVYVTYTIDECTHMRETECTLYSFYNPYNDNFFLLCLLQYLVQRISWLNKYMFIAQQLYQNRKMTMRIILSQNKSLKINLCLSELEQ